MWAGECSLAPSRLNTFRYGIMRSNKDFQRHLMNASHFEPSSNDNLPFSILVIRKQERKAELEESVQFYNDEEYARWNYFVQEQELMTNEIFGAWVILLRKRGLKEPLAMNQKELVVVKKRLEAYCG